MAFDADLQRKIMGKFATGVTVVTSDGPAGKCGLTANAVTSLSLDPPLVLVAVDKRAGAHAGISKNGCFAVNVLASEQEPLSRRFASSGPKEFADLNARAVETGAPVLPDTLGFVDCTLQEVLPGGDHDIFIGRIVAGEFREGRPLLYFAGKYAQLAE
jgi:flavin reductase (DIM6/NTAB) family NADH-FMN oxidoreductase RutF